MMRKEDNGSMAARLSLAAGVLLMLLAGTTEARDPNNKHSEHNLFLGNLDLMIQRIKQIIAGAALLNKTIPTYSQYSFESYIDLSEEAELDSEFDRIVTQYIPFVKKRQSEKICKKCGGFPTPPLTAIQQVCITSYSDFKADWATPFDPKQTSKEPFYKYNGSGDNITVMTRTGLALYKEDKDQFKIQMLTLPFASLDSVLVLMKPTDGTDIYIFGERVYSDFENLVKNVIYQQAPTNVTIRLPKYKVTENIDFSIMTDKAKKIWTYNAAQTAILKKYPDTSFNYFMSNTTLELNEEGVNYQAHVAAGNVECQGIPERKIPTLKKSDLQSPFAVPEIVNLVAGTANETLEPASETVVEFSGDSYFLYMILTTDLTVLATGDYYGT